MEVKQNSLPSFSKMMNDERLKLGFGKMFFGKKEN